MKKPADSIILSIINLALLGLAWVGKLTHVGCCSIGQPAGILVLVIVPIVLLLTFVSIVKDVIRASTRVQAIFALLLSIPVGVMIFSIRY